MNPRINSLYLKIMMEDSVDVLQQSAPTLSPKLPDPRLDILQNSFRKPPTLASPSSAPSQISERCHDDSSLATMVEKVEIDEVGGLDTSGWQGRRTTMMLAKEADNETYSDDQGTTDSLQIDDLDGPNAIPPSRNCFDLQNWAEFSTRIEVDEKAKPSKWQHCPEMDKMEKSVIEILTESPQFSTLYLGKANRSENPKPWKSRTLYKARTPN